MSETRVKNLRQTWVKFEGFVIAGKGKNYIFSFSLDKLDISLKYKYRQQKSQQS